MPGHMDKGTKNYRDMMKNMEKGMGEEKIPAPMNMGMDSMRNLDRMGGEAIPSRQDMGMDSMSRDDAMQRILDPNSVVRKGEMAGMNALENAISNMPMADREAIEALTSMGISLEDAVEAILDPNSTARRDEMLEGAVGATMGAGALGALPMRKQGTVMREGEMGADRTENPMNPLTSRNAPST